MTRATLETVIFEIQDGIAWISLNRTDAANSRNQLMRDELGEIWTELHRRSDILVAVLSGAGAKYFCAGMDLKEAGAHESTSSRRERMTRNRDIERLASLPQITIAAINGFALGGGLEMALACDIRIIADHAQIGMPEVTKGIVPAGGGTHRLPRLIGYARATELVVLGTRLVGPDAVAWGLASKSVPSDQLLREAQSMAQEIASRSPKALRYAKELLSRSQDVGLDVSLDSELDAILDLLSTEPECR